jgi:hypothetical protein
MVLVAMGVVWAAFFLPQRAQRKSTENTEAWE